MKVIKHKLKEVVINNIIDYHSFAVTMMVVVFNAHTIMMIDQVCIRYFLLCPYVNAFPIIIFSYYPFIIKI